MEGDLNRLLFESQQDEHRDALLSRCRDTIESLSQEVEEERRMRRSAETEARRLNNEVALLEEQLNESRVKIEVQTREVTSLISESQERQRIAVGLKEQLKAAQQARDELLRVSESTSRELQKSQDKLHLLKQDLTHKQQVMDEWSKTLKAVDDRISSLTTENDDLKRELQGYVTKCDDLLRQNEHLVQGWKTAKDDSQVLHGELAKLKNDSKDVFEVLQRQKKSIQQKLNETVEEKTTALQEQIKSCIDSLQVKLDRCNVELSTLRKSKAQLQQENAKLTRKIEVAEQNVEELKGQFNEAASEAEALRKQIISRETDQKLTYKQKEKRLRELEANLNGTQAALRQKQQELELSFAENENASKVALQTVEGELSRMQAELLAKRSEVNMLRRDNDLLANASVREAENLKSQFEGDLRRIRTELKLEYERRLHKAKQNLENQLQQKKAEMEAEALKTTGNFNEAMTDRDTEIERLNLDRKQLREVVAELQERLCEVTERLDKFTKKRASVEANLRQHAAEEADQLHSELDILKSKHRQEVELFQSEVHRKDQEYERLRARFREKLEKASKLQSIWKERLMQEIGYLNKWIETDDAAIAPRIKAVAARMELALMSDSSR